MTSSGESTDGANHQRWVCGRCNCADEGDQRRLFKGRNYNLRVESFVASVVCVDSSSRFCNVLIYSEGTTYIGVCAAVQAP